MRLFLILLSPLLIIGCLSSKVDSYNLKISDIQLDIDTVQVEENGVIENVEVGLFWVKVPYHNDSLLLNISTFGGEAFDTLIPIISDQLNWLSLNKKEVISKYKSSFQTKGKIRLTMLWVSDNGDCTIHFKHKGTQLEKKLNLTTNKSLSITSN